MTAKAKKGGESGKFATKSAKFKGGQVGKDKHGGGGSGKFQDRKGNGNFARRKQGRTTRGKAGQSNYRNAGQSGKWRSGIVSYSEWKVTEKDGEMTTRKEQAEKFPGRKVVDPKLLEKYGRGEGVNVRKIKKWNKPMVHKIKMKEQKLKEAEEEAARVELLLTESSGQLEAKEGTYTAHITQSDIKKAVDITTAAKGFDLKLEYGPYVMDYTRNGRHLLIGGRKGHLASFDWITKKLHFETNVMESIHDLCFLHTERMMAVAQKQWVYVYDNQGVELHCLKMMHRTLQLEFLPYHFLLCAGNESGILSWLDISLGKEVIRTRTGKGRLGIMCQNPYNAVLCCGHPNGTVTMWTPNSRLPVASILCHTQPLRKVTVDPSGRYMATAGVDRQLKIWDVRNLGECLKSYYINAGASHLSFSQKGLLAMSMGNVVEVYRNVVNGGCKKPYMQHKGGNTIHGMQFCPYEDVLGISTYNGFSSLIIPGAGEPNYDALEANPYISTSGRREAEVKSLLAKVPSELITLDPMSICQVDTPTLQERIEAKKTLLHVRAPRIDPTPRYRMKGKSGSATMFKRKQKVREDAQRGYLKTALRQQAEAGLGKDYFKDKQKQKEQQKEQPTVLDRFKPKAAKKK
ncbi:WD repeat-containing protein 46-like [Penaeus indicus]|uniref:WD repeat-containing protein 46-like n=1 Tax=Penaeus indicus TaxID=29960 RepID=UPI00300CC555